MHIFHHTGLSGDVIRSVEVGSKEECCDLCGSRSDCKAWTYAHKWDQCQLLSDVHGKWTTTDFCGGSKDLVAINVEGHETNISVVV